MSPTNHRLLGIYGLIALVVMLFAPASIQLAHLWTDFGSLSYTHGFALAAVSLWLIFRDRAQLAAIPRSYSWSATAAFLVCACAWVYFWNADIRDAYLVLLPALIWLGLCACFGWPVASRLAFPVGYLFFTLPAWSWLNPLMRVLTVHGVSFLLPLTGIPAQVSDPFIVVPAGTFEIAGGCTGLHFLTVGLALGALHGELNRDGFRAHCKWLALMGVLAILTNWVRIVIIIVFGQLTQMRSSLIGNHYRFGWAVFAVALLVFVWIARRSDRSATFESP